MRNHHIKFGRLVFVHLQSSVSLSAFCFNSVYPDVLSPSAPLPHFANLSACFKGDKMAAACGRHKQEQKCVQILVGKHDGKRRLVGAKIDGKRRRIAGCGLDSSCLGYRPVVRRCEHGNESAGSVKCGESSF
jgi:hypothetical protein